MEKGLNFEVLCSDGFRLSATLFSSAKGEPNERVAIINSGAGIPARYYQKFALWLAARGIPTITYDYRGIGESRPRTLRGFEASVEDWGSKDCAAVLRSIKGSFPQAHIAVIGHSIGGFVTGFVTDVGSIDRLVFIGGHTGFYGDYRRSVRLQMFLTWHVLMPAVTQIVGYFPGRRFGLPADLPMGVALEWAARIRPNFWWNIRRGGSPDFKRIDELRSRFAAFSAKGLLLRTRDDSFATAGSSARLAALFSNTEFSQGNLNPKRMGLGRVGHFGYFRSKCRNSIWPLIENWVAIGQLDRSNLEAS